MKGALISLCIAVIFLSLVFSRPPLKSDYASGENFDERSGQKNVVASAPVYPPLRHYSAIVSKPLFISLRQGRVMNSTQAAVPSDISLVLDGLIKTPDAEFALLREKNKPDSIKLMPGDVIGSWSLLEIGKGQVILGRGEERVALHLYDQKNESSAQAVPSIGIGKAVAAREAALPRGSVTRPADMSRLLKAQGRVDPNAEATRMMDEFEEQINEQRL